MRLALLGMTALVAEHHAMLIGTPHHNGEYTTRS
jgi:hypothetical protein